MLVLLAGVVSPTLPRLLHGLILLEIHLLLLIIARLLLAFMGLMLIVRLVLLLALSRAWWTLIVVVRGTAWPTSTSIR
jgi:hypothetical protein